MYVIALPCGNYVGKRKRRFTDTVPECSAHRFNSRLAAKIVNSHRKGTIRKLSA